MVAPGYARSPGRTNAVSRILGATLMAGMLAVATPAHADATPAPAAAPSEGVVAVTARHDARRFVVVALPGATDAAWPLAVAMYRTPELAGRAPDEPFARALAGEKPTTAAPREIHDLAETVMAIHGDDAVSRKLLASIAQEQGAAYVLLVFPATATSKPQARVFVAATGSFDAALFLSDDAAAGAAANSTTWTGAMSLIGRLFAATATAPVVAPHPLPAPVAALPPVTAEVGPGSPPPPPPPPPGTGPVPTTVLLDTTALPPPPSKPHMFYESGWFWGAIGGAALVGVAAYFLTRDSGPNSVHVQMTVP